MSQENQTDTPHFDYLVDALGESCPMPLLKAKMQLNKMEVGETLKLAATDPGSQRDVRAFVALTNHELIDYEDVQSSQYIYFITKGIKESLS